MWHVFKAVLRYGKWMPQIVDFIELAQEVQQDGKISRKEKEKLIKSFSDFIDRVAADPY